MLLWEVFNLEKKKSNKEIKSSNNSKKNFHIFHKKCEGHLHQS